MHVETLLSIVSIDNRGTVFMLQLLLSMVPELFPGGAAVLGTRDPGFEIDAAHVHHVERVLVLERGVGNEAGVNGDQGAEMGYGADA